MRDRDRKRLDNIIKKFENSSLNYGEKARDFFSFFKSKFILIGMVVIMLLIVIPLGFFGGLVKEKE